jgi:hypothetical protein
MRRIKSSKSIVNKKNPVITLVSAYGLDDKDFKIFRKEVEKAFSEPNYSLISNYEINIQRVEIIKDAKFHNVWADGISKKETDDLRKEVEKALQNPEYVIITNYYVNWEQVL